MKKVFLTTVCTAALVGFWCLRSIQPVSPLLPPTLIKLSLPEAVIRAEAPINFELVLPEVVIKADLVKKA